MAEYIPFCGLQDEEIELIHHWKQSNESPYSILGLESSCSLEDISKSFRKLALSFHPDKSKQDTPSTSEKFQKIHSAYRLLSQPRTRECYDEFLKRKKKRKWNSSEVEDLLSDETMQALHEREKEHAKKKKEVSLSSLIHKMKETSEKRFEMELEKRKQRKQQMEWEQKHAILVVKWNEKSEYSQERLHHILGMFGDVKIRMISKNEALVFFQRYHAAQVAKEQTLGDIHNPLQLKWYRPSNNIQKQKDIHKNEESMNVTLEELEKSEKSILEQLRQRKS